MAKRLYIGNLSYNTTEDTLTKTFSATAVVIPTDHSGRPKGFAFVDVEDDQADELIQKWNGQDLEGRNIVVSEARPREDRSGQRGDNNFRRAA
jgi:cold-inducible RNA-binding protein